MSEYSSSEKSRTTSDLEIFVYASVEYAKKTDSSVIESTFWPVAIHSNTTENCISFCKLLLMESLASREKRPQSTQLHYKASWKIKSILS